MGSYDNRESPTYHPARIEWAQNPHILAWWTKAHDGAIAQAIEAWQWNWSLKIAEAVIALTPEVVLARWREQDQLCRKYAWYNILMGFSEARAQVLNMTARIRKPERKTCGLCQLPFMEDSLPLPLVERLGMDHLDVCAPCCRDTVLFRGRSETRRKDIVFYIRSLAELAGRVPPQGFGEHTGDLVHVDGEIRLKIFALMRSKPSTAAIKAGFGSWFDALVASGVLEGGARQNIRGIQCHAKDGHLCFSLGEKTIDDILFNMGLTHEREPSYPESSLRADFKVGDTLIEYFGLAGDPNYDKKTKTKVELARQHNVRLLSILPRDLADTKRLVSKLGILKGMR
jgi:hypothetical protein